MTQSTPYAALGIRHNEIIRTLLTLAGYSKTTSRIAALISFRMYKDGVVVQTRNSMRNDVYCSLPTVNRAIAKLQQDNILIVSTPSPMERLNGETCKYQFNMDKILKLVKKFMKQLTSLFPTLKKMIQGKIRGKKQQDKGETKHTGNGGKFKMIQGTPYNTNTKTNTKSKFSNTLQDIQNKFNASDEIMDRAIALAEKNTDVINGKWPFTRCVKGILRNIVPGYKEKEHQQRRSIEAALKREADLKEQQTIEKPAKPKINFKKVREMLTINRKKERERKEKMAKGF